MKLTSVLLTVLVAVVLQVTLARYTVGGRWVFDLVLVGVVFAALQWGPVAGMMAGTLGGLLQDVLRATSSASAGWPRHSSGLPRASSAPSSCWRGRRRALIVVAGATILHRLIDARRCMA